MPGKANEGAQKGPGRDNSFPRSPAGPQGLLLLHRRRGDPLRRVPQDLPRPGTQRGIGPPASRRLAGQPSPSLLPPWPAAHPPIDLCDRQNCLAKAVPAGPVACVWPHHPWAVGRWLQPETMRATPAGRLTGACGPKTSASSTRIGRSTWPSDAARPAPPFHPTRFGRAPFHPTRFGRAKDGWRCWDRLGRKSAGGERLSGPGGQAVPGGTRRRLHKAGPYVQWDCLCALCGLCLRWCMMTVARRCLCSCTSCCTWSVACSTWSDDLRWAGHPASGTPRLPPARMSASWTPGRGSSRDSVAAPADLVVATPAELVDGEPWRVFQ
jgi:hypothetical protein